MTAVTGTGESFDQALCHFGWPYLTLWADEGQASARRVLLEAARRLGANVLQRLAESMEAGWTLRDVNGEAVCPGHLVTAHSHTISYGEQKGTVGRWISVATKAPFWDVVMALEVMFAAWPEGDQDFTWMPPADGHTPWCKRRDHGRFGACRVSLGKVERPGRQTPARLHLGHFLKYGLLDPDGPTIYISERISCLTIDQAAELADILRRAVDMAREEPVESEPGDTIEAVQL